MRIGLLIAGTVVVAGTLAAMRPGEQARKIRVGVYDNRAITIAFVPSKYAPTEEKMREHEAAKAAGNEAQVKELEAWGEKQQRKYHRQGFGRMPVNDLLAHVADRFPALAKELGVDVITRECDYTAEGVEVVDITLDLVKLFDPSERTLTWAAQIKDKAPVDLDDLENHDH